MWAACHLAFFGLRFSEFTIPKQSQYDPLADLSLQDVTLDNIKNPSMVYVQIKESKIDPFCKGYTHQTPMSH